MIRRELLQIIAGKLAGGMFRAFGNRAKRGFGVLLYHRTAPPVSGLQRPTMNVPPQRLEQQLRGLLRRGFEAWSLPRLLAAAEAGRAIPPRAFAVTFDDGFESVYHYAWPILRRLEIPATIFLTTGYLDADEPFFFDDWALAHRSRIPSDAFLPLRRWQCAEMAAGGLVTFGAHSHTHRDYRGDPDGFRQEVAESARWIRQWFDPSRVLFAYPFGKPALGFVTPPLMAAAREAEVCCGLTTDPRRVLPGSDPFQWGRFNVYHHDTPGTLAGKLTGWWLGELFSREIPTEPSRDEPSWNGQSHAEQSSAEQSHAEQSRAEQSRAEQSHAEQSHAEQSHAEQSHAEQSHTEQSHAEQSHAEQSREEPPRDGRGPFAGATDAASKEARA